MVCCEWQQYPIHQQNVFEIVDDALPVKKVHGCSQKVPVQRFREPQVPVFAGDIGNRNNLLKGHNLNGGNDGNEVYMTGEHRTKETGNHDKGPYRSSDEGLFLLLVVRESRSVRNLLLLAWSSHEPNSRLDTYLLWIAIGFVDWILAIAYF